MISAGRTLAAGTKVKVKTPGAVPSWSTWDDDRQRTSTPVKRRLQEMFFRGDKRVAASIVYVSSESQRQKLKMKKQVKVQLRDAAGASITIVACPDNLVAA